MIGELTTSSKESLLDAGCGGAARWGQPHIASIGSLSTDATGSGAVGRRYRSDRQAGPRSGQLCDCGKHNWGLVRKPVLIPQRRPQQPTPATTTTTTTTTTTPPHHHRRRLDQHRAGHQGSRAAGRQGKKQAKHTHAGSNRHCSFAQEIPPFLAILPFGASRRR